MAFELKEKNRNIILESKMAEPNQYKKSQQPGWPDSMWKLDLSWKWIT